VVLTAIATTCAATGWLYVLRHARVLDVGPHVAGGLPLLQLAHTDDQPLLRMAVAWLPAGMLGGLLLTRLRPARGVVARGALFGLVTAVVLVLAGAESQAIEFNDVIRSQLGPVAGHSGVWLGVVLATAGALLGQLIVRPVRRGGRAVASAR
jgi:hypothetical protein